MFDCLGGLLMTSTVVDRYFPKILTLYRPSSVSWRTINLQPHISALGGTIFGNRGVSRVQSMLMKEKLSLGADRLITDRCRGVIEK